MDRNYERQGIASKLMKTAHEIAVSYFQA
ncbi:hypothetical protein [Butyrivibrio sp. NC3005]